MDNVSENFSRGDQYSGIRKTKLRKRRTELKTEDCKQYRKRFRRKSGFENSEEKGNCDLVTVERVPYEGSNYLEYSSPRYRTPRNRKVKGYEAREEQLLKGFCETDTVRSMQGEMQEMKEKLCAVVETLSKVAEALVKASGQTDERNQNNDGPDRSPSVSGNEKAVQCNERKVEPPSRRRKGFCCLGLRSVNSSESDSSDYYRPQEPRNTESKLSENEHRRCSASSSDHEFRVNPVESLSLESNKSQTFEQVTLCYFFQQLLYRAKVLFF